MTKPLTPVNAMDLDRLDVLILARLAGPTKSVPQPAQLRKDVGRFLAARLSPGELHALIDDRLAALRTRGDLVATGPLAVTEAGRRRVQDALGVTSIPAWKALRTWLAPALALGLDPAQAKVRARLRDADGLRGAALRRGHDLPGPDAPTLRQAVDALAWRQLGVDTDRPLTLNAVRRHLLSGLLAGKSRLELDKLVALLAADSAGAGRTEPDALRDALVRDWLAPAPSSDAWTADPRGTSTPAPTAPAASTPAPAAPAPPTPTHAPAPTTPVQTPTTPALAPSVAPAELDLGAFARLVQAAADTAHGPEDGRFGARKVFISALWRRLRAHPACAHLDFGGFKGRLVEANRANLLALHRADLVQAMDPAEVRASETHFGNATFHFVERSPGG
ncbi:hypothetical protein [Haliangium sp.]|uniref:hypothetical protein n=1 Tax=Haliangium sp. TaxID=2663208 RepID=UPI003D114827